MNHFRLLSTVSGTQPYDSAHHSYGEWRALSCKFTKLFPFPDSNDFYPLRLEVFAKKVVSDANYLGILQNRCLFNIPR